MNPFEYLLLFASVILGLAISDIAISLHKVLGAGARVKWDWLAPLAAVLALVKIVTQWWAWYAAAKYAQGLTFGMFLGVVVSAIMLFLLSAAALPDKADEPVVDLAAYYRSISRRYWILFVAHLVLVNTISIWAQMQIRGARLDLLSPGTAVLGTILLVSLSMVFVRNRWWHTAAMLALIGFYSVQSFGQALT